MKSGPEIGGQKKRCKACVWTNMAAEAPTTGIAPVKRPARMTVPLRRQGARADCRQARPRPLGHRPKDKSYGNKDDQKPAHR